MELCAEVSTKYFILTPINFRWFNLYPNEGTRLAVQYMLRIWKEVRIGGVKLDYTGTLLSFGRTLLLSHICHDIMRRREGDGKGKGRRIIEKLIESSSKKQGKKSMGGKRSIFAYWFSLFQSSACFIIIGHFIFFPLFFCCHGCTII